MNSKERVLQTLDYKEPDRVPIGEWGIDHDTAEKVIGRDTYWRNRRKETLALWAGKRDEVVESYKKDLVELIEKLDQDLVPVHFVPPRDLQPEKIKQIDEKTWEDQGGRIFKYSAGNDAILCVSTPSIRRFQSKEEVREFFESEYAPDAGFKIKKKGQDGKAKICIDEGVDTIMPGGDFSDSNGPMVSPETIRRIFLPGMKKLSDYGHQRGVRVMSHNCGNNWKIMDILIEAGYECWQSIACKTADMDLKRLKEKYGNKIAFWGGINIETLVDGTPEENRKDVLYALKYAAPGGGFISGTSNSVCFGSKYDNYMAALETLHKYGDYPLK